MLTPDILDALAVGDKVDGQHEDWLAPGGT